MPARNTLEGLKAPPDGTGQEQAAVGARSEARRVLADAGLRPRRRFGQHFLCDRAVVERIVRTAALGQGTTVLEIGPGLGALTEALAACAARVHAIEIDRDLAARLRERFAAQPWVTVHEGDVLALPLGEIVPEPDAVVVANLPYNISTPILFRLLEQRARFPRAVLMLQREVALRLTARPGSRTWGVLPVLIQTWGDVQFALAVSRHSFLPRPRVDSAVVTIAWRREPCVSLEDPLLFRAVVRAAFGQRRKTLRNALGALAAGRGVAIEAVLDAARIDPRARAEVLTLEDFARIARAIGSAGGSAAVVA